MRKVCSKARVREPTSGHPSVSGRGAERPQRNCSPHLSNEGYPQRNPSTAPNHPHQSGAQRACVRAETKWDANHERGQQAGSSVLDGRRRDWSWSLLEATPAAAGGRIGGPRPTLHTHYSSTYHMVLPEYSSTMVHVRTSSSTRVLEYVHVYEVLLR